jgi:hypothetical protein
MNFKKAIELVLNEAESSALGENNQEVLDAVEMVGKFYRTFGHHFQNFTLPEELNLDKD